MVNFYKKFREDLKCLLWKFQCMAGICTLLICLPILQMSLSTPFFPLHQVNFRSKKTVLQRRWWWMVVQPLPLSQPQWQILLGRDLQLGHGKTWDRWWHCMDELERVMVFNEEDEHENPAVLSAITITKMYRIRDFLLVFVHGYLFSMVLRLSFTYENQICMYNHIVT